MEPDRCTPSEASHLASHAPDRRTPLEREQRLRVGAGEIDQRARPVGLEVIETCCWWDSGRKPSAEEQRFQVTFERV